MLKRLTRFSIKLVLIFTIFAPLIHCSTKPKLEDQKIKELKSASLSCDVKAFREFMTPKTYSKVVELDAQIEALKKINNSIFIQLQKKFGSEIEKSEKGIKFSFNGNDPRWSKIFGHDFDSYVKANPNGPFDFNINFDIRWEQECNVIQRFQACLEDKDFCSEYYAKGSDIGIRKTSDGWNIIYIVSLQKEKHKNKMKKLLLQLANWTDEYLLHHKDALPNEDFKIQLTYDFFTKRTQLQKELKEN